MNYKRWLIITVLLFGIGLVLGLVTPSGISGLPAEDIAALEEMVDLLEALPQSFVLVLIFLKNVTALLVSLVFSPLFCLLPVMALLINGWVLGIVSASVVREQSLGFLLAGLLPHGVFELPAFIMGEAVALSVGTNVMLAPFKSEARNQLLPNLKRNLRYLAIALALLLPAAVIETYVTPLFLP